MSGVKVCHISDVHTRYDNRIFVKECSSLAAKGYDVSFVIADELENEIRNEVTILSTHHKHNGRFLRMTKDVKNVYILAKNVNADIYHLHDPELLRIALKLKRLGKKVIFDSHEFSAEQILVKEYIPKMLRRLVYFIYKKYQNVVLRKLDGVICPCLYDGIDYFERVNSNRCLINNVPRLSEFDIDFGNQNIRPKDNRVCYVGAITEDRGIETMVKAVENTDICLVLAGTFMPVSLLAKVEAMPGWKNVEYVGHLQDRNKINELIRNCSIGLCLLKDKGQYGKLYNLPTKVYEYLGNGIPVIASDFTFYKSVIETEKCGICINPDDADGLRKAIKELINNPNVLMDYGRNGKEMIKEKYCWEIEEQKLVSYYDWLKLTI